eukprot:scaffold11684_cov122-Isochrysis_galbana.AAC.8
MRRDTLLSPGRLALPPFPPPPLPFPPARDLLSQALGGGTGVALGVAAAMRVGGGRAAVSFLHRRTVGAGAGCTGTCITTHKKMPSARGAMGRMERAHPSKDDPGTI